MNLKKNPVDFNCVALHKIAKAHKLFLPPPNIQLYLAKIINDVNDPSKKYLFEQYVVESYKNLEKIILKYQDDSQPNIVPELVAQYSGDYSLNFSAMSQNEKGFEFPSLCYSFVNYCAQKGGNKDKAQTMELLSMNIIEYMNLLSKYYQHLRNTKFTINDKDFENFKAYLMKEAKQKEIILQPVKGEQENDEGKSII